MERKGLAVGQVFGIFDEVSDVRHEMFILKRLSARD
jgi:hypothetical protein